MEFSPVVAKELSINSSWDRIHISMCGELTPVLLSLGPLGALLDRNLNLKYKPQRGITISN